MAWLIKITVLPACVIPPCSCATAQTGSRRSACDSVLLPITALLKHFGKISLRKFDVLLEELCQFGELFRTGFYGGVNDPITHRTDPFCQRSGFEAYAAVSRVCAILPQLRGKTAVNCEAANLRSCQNRPKLRSSSVRNCPKTSRARL